MKTKMIRDHIPDPQDLVDHPLLLTAHADDMVHIVWIQEADQECTTPHWAYANLIQTSADMQYKTHTVQALVDQHRRATTETNQLLSTMEGESSAYPSTSTESIADLRNDLQQYLDETKRLNTSLQQKIHDYKTANDSYNLPDVGSTT